MKKELTVLLVLLSVFLATGCTDNGNEVSDEKVAMVTEEASVSEQEPVTITVSAAASLTEAFTDMETRFEKENSGTDIILNFGGSGNLRTQIEGGAPVDVFASADESQMDTLASKSLIENSTRQDFARNSLVLIVPANNTLNITSLEDLADSRVEKIAIGNPETVPVGKYASTALNEAEMLNQTEDKFVLAEDVKQVLVYVERGEVDAGFVYMTDAKTAGPGVISIVTDVSVSTPVAYPIAVVFSSENKEEAKEFVDFVAGEKGQEILEEYGFTPESE